MFNLCYHECVHFWKYLPTESLRTGVFTGNMLTCSPPNYMVLNVGDVLHQLNANWLTSRLEPGRRKQWSSPGMGEEKKIPKHPRLKKK